jgi:23S rRNA (adenine-N6)-dimethyltransferase
VPGHPGLWGWHELDRRWAERLVDYAEIQPGDLVVDVGAGAGVITHALLRAGARVIAVELHPRRAAALRVRFASQRVKIVQADAADLRLPRRPFKVVANPPFGITTALLRRLTSPASRLERASLILPAWAAMRWAAGRGVGGVASRRRFERLLGGRVPAHAFRPRPLADATILIIERARNGGT